jgi:hypothetical protein
LLVPPKITGYLTFISAGIIGYYSRSPLREAINESILVFLQPYIPVRKKYIAQLMLELDEREPQAKKRSTK